MFTLYSADIAGNPGNCSYPNRHDVTDEAGLKAAICHDYVCADYKNHYRTDRYQQCHYFCHHYLNFHHYKEISRCRPREGSIANFSLG